MPSNDDPNGREESTKQVDRDQLNAALNRSVDSKSILNRVNASVQEEVHAEGTAQVDRDAVARYIEAARSGEFPALGGEQAETDGPVEGRVPESSEMLAEPSESVYESPERDTTGPKAAIFRRTPSKGAKAIPGGLKLPPPPRLPTPTAGTAPGTSTLTNVEEADATELLEGSPANADLPENLATSLAEESAPHSGPSGIEFADIQQAIGTPAPSPAPAPNPAPAPVAVAAQPDDAQQAPPAKTSTSPWMGIILLAVVGTLLGAVVGAIFVWMK